MNNVKIKSSIILFLLITLLFTISNASYSNVIMTVVEEPVCTIKIGEDSAFEKKLISKDLNNKEVTIQLQVTNNEKAFKPTGEVMLVIDNSYSMIDENNATNGKLREELVIESAKTLVEKLLKDNDQLKIGAVSFSTNTDINKEGTLEDAALVSELTNDSSALLNAISNIEYNGPRTDLDSGLKLAKNYFSNNVDSAHKYLIVLTDGVPNVAVDYDKNWFSDDVIEKTKASLQSYSSIVDNVFIMLTGITNGDANATRFVGEPKTYNQIISEIFGTPENPTIGKFYYVTDAEVEDTIKNTIYNALVPSSTTLKNIKVVDKFPQYIIDNFDFAYVSKANIGEISAEIDKTNRTITWTIPELKSGETATVQYKLKLKESYSTSILDKVLNTNENESIEYTDPTDKTQKKDSDITPKIKLQEPAVTALPKAGKIVLYSFIGASLCLVVLFGTKVMMINRRMK